MSLLDELEKRKRLRQKKLREEKRREKRIEIEENKKQGKCKKAADSTDEKLHLRGLVLTCGTLSLTDPEVHIGLENLQHFPAFGGPSQSSPPVQPDSSPLSSSPSAGESSSASQ